MRIGIVDLDTSHPAAWIPIERELGHDIVGVWDGGAVHPPEYTRIFAEKHSIPRIFETLSDMAAEVDCAIIHGCDWDTHLEKARPFIRAGRGVLLDKPLAGNAAELQELCRLAEAGVRITGGSALRFCREVRAFLQRPTAERGEPHTALCGCGVDDFNYGIHAYAMLNGIMGPGAKTVRHLGKGAQHRLQVSYGDGRMGLLVTGETTEWLPFFASIVTDRRVEQIVADTGDLYRALLEVTLPYLSGEAPPPLPMAHLVEPELCALAAKLSSEDGDREVALTELDACAVRYDGRAFAAGYRRQKYP